MNEKRALPLRPAIELEHPGALSASREALLARWYSLPDKGTALRLAFLEWWSCVEPSFLTGLPDYDDSASLFPELAAFLTSPSEIDSTVRFVLGWMSKSFPWCCGCGPTPWEAVGEKLWSEFLASGDVDMSEFSDDSTYGVYFTHIYTSTQQKRSPDTGD
ncbi:hypothetical protein ACIPWF_06150 [Paenarthrobacter sp. NPDC089989]|uniref:hypothetical protein n=1 Tax=unclassified Paenarthrobacter TaxID=2634190 RepID=UPI0038071F7E